MIINCPNCNKRFKINTSLIPVEGRDLKCGSCDHVWFYKIEDKNLEPLSLKEDIINNEDKPEIVDKKIERTNEVKKSSSHSKIDIKDKKGNDKLLLDEWRDSLHYGIKHRFKDTNIILQGGVDDVWFNTKTKERELYWQRVNLETNEKSQPAFITSMPTRNSSYFLAQSPNKLFYAVFKQYNFDDQI